MAVTTPTEDQDSEPDRADKREFWAWVEQEKAELQRRIESCNDPDLPERRARELLDELREHAVRPLSADFEIEILDPSRSWTRATSNRCTTRSPRSPKPFQTA